MVIFRKTFNHGIVRHITCSRQFAATVCLHGYRVQSVGSLGVSGRRHAFELIPPDSRLMYFYFVAETETEKKR